ncbi:TPA: hypothetical protein N2D99_001991 [Clostridium botulinum]|nr:hypothetical protein [Clostridium botulinum]
MECELCESKEIELIKEEKDAKLNIHVGDYEEFSTLYLKCRKCGHEFTECV